MDSMAAHKSVVVRAAFKRIGVTAMFLPVRAACYLSPLDNTLFATFKRAFAVACDEAAGERRRGDASAPVRNTADGCRELVRVALAPDARRRARVPGALRAGARRAARAAARARVCAVRGRVDVASAWRAPLLPTACGGA